MSRVRRRSRGEAASTCVSGTVNTAEVYLRSERCEGCEGCERCERCERLERRTVTNGGRRLAGLGAAEAGARGLALALVAIHAAVRLREQGLVGFAVLWEHGGAGADQHRDPEVGPHFQLHVVHRL